MEVIPIRNRIYSILITLCLCLGMVSMTAARVNAENTRITDPDAVCGSDYTTSPALARKLDDIFNGSAGIYWDSACTNEVDTTLGTSPVRNNGVYMFVNPTGGSANNIGTSCFIYANGVYYTLFGESTGSGMGENSENLRLSGTGSRSLTYRNLKAWGVRQGVGALIRASGHSMIVLGYDEETLTILDGNSNGRGLVSISEKNWDQCGEYVEYIIQPTDSHYEDLYTWGMCGEESFWSVDEQGTLTISGSGSIAYPGWDSYRDSIRKVVIRDGGNRIGSGVFYSCQNLNTIVFQSAAPVFEDGALLGVNAEIYYPGPEEGWTQDFLRDYGGEPVWIPYGTTELKITQQPALAESLISDMPDVTIAAEGADLCYNWYVKNAGDDLYLKSNCTEPVYRAQAGTAADQQVICVVTDRYGNFLISDSVLIPLCGEDHSQTCR